MSKLQTAKEARENTLLSAVQNDFKGILKEIFEDIDLNIQECIKKGEFKLYYKNLNINMDTFKYIYIGLTKLGYECMLISYIQGHIKISW